MRVVWGLQSMLLDPKKATNSCVAHLLHTDNFGSSICPHLPLRGEHWHRSSWLRSGTSGICSSGSAASSVTWAWRSCWRTWPFLAVCRKLGIDIYSWLLGRFILWCMIGDGSPEAPLSFFASVYGSRVQEKELRRAVVGTLSAELGLLTHNYFYCDTYIRREAMGWRRREKYLRWEKIAPHRAAAYVQMPDKCTKKVTDQRPADPKERTQHPAICCSLSNFLSNF